VFQYLWLNALTKKNPAAFVAGFLKHFTENYYLPSKPILKYTIVFRKFFIFYFPRWREFSTRDNDEVAFRHNTKKKMIKRWRDTTKQAARAKHARARGQFTPKYYAQFVRNLQYSTILIIYALS